MLVFLLKSTACLAIFLAFYKLMLEKESIHHFKRFYLLGALIASFTIPSIVFIEYVEVAQVSFTETPTILNGSETLAIQPIVEGNGVEPGLILWSIYGLGVFAFAFRFLRNLGQIWYRIRKNPKLKDHFITCVLLAQQLPPHTFFSYVFLNKSQYESHNIPEEVLLHEETHAKQRHSLDVLLIELAQVILWFNPLIYLLKSYIKLNHEFLADREVINKSHDHTHYQNTLLSYLSHDSFEKYQSTGIANAINYSSIKKRFTVMKTNTSKRSFVLRSLLVLPLMALLLSGFTETRQIEREHSTDQIIGAEANASLSDLTTYNLLAKKYNAMPIEKRVIPLKDLKVLEAIYRNMDETQKENAQPFPECLPQHTTQKTVDLIEINIDSKGQLLVQNDKVRLEDLKTYLSKINDHLSFDQRKKVVRSVVKVAANTSKDIIHQVDQILTEYGSATINIVGPERSSQSSASREEMKEYNTLAKKYNEMDHNNMVIKKKEVMRLKVLYGKMSQKQRADAEPFPNFPPPPPAPDAPEPPKNVSDTEYASNQIENIVATQDPYDVIGNTMNINNTLPAPPPPPEPKSPLEHIKEMAAKGAIFTFNGEDISSEKAIEVVKENKFIYILSMTSKGDHPVVKLGTEPIEVEN